MYFVHYIFVVWTQFVLLKFSMPAFLKFMITFILSFALSGLRVYCAGRLSCSDCIYDEIYLPFDHCY